MEVACYDLCLFGICVGLFGIGTFSQVNGIASAVNNFFDPNQQHTVAIPGIGTYSWTVVIASLVLSICVALVLIGGIKRIANVSQIVVPFMAIIYVVISLTLIICNITEIPAAIVTVVKEHSIRQQLRVAQWEHCLSQCRAVWQEEFSLMNQDLVLLRSRQQQQRLKNR